MSEHPERPRDRWEDEDDRERAERLEWEREHPWLFGRQGQPGSGQAHASIRQLEIPISDEAFRNGWPDETRVALSRHLTTIRRTTCEPDRTRAEHQLQDLLTYQRRFGNLEFTNDEVEGIAAMFAAAFSAH